MMVPPAKPEEDDERQLPGQKGRHLTGGEANGPQRAQFDEAPAEREECIEEEAQDGQQGGGQEADGQDTKEPLTFR